MSEILEIVANEFVVEETLITNTLDITNEDSIAVTEEVIALVSEAVQGPQGIPGPKGDTGDINPQMPVLLSATENARDVAVIAADRADSAAASANASAEATAADRLQTGQDVITATEKSDIATAKAKEASDSANSALTSETKASDSALIAQAAAAIYSDLQINMMQMANSMIQTQTIVAQHYAFA